MILDSKVWRLVMVAGLGLAAALSVSSQGKVWEVIADKDQTFKVIGERKPVITVKAGETVHLRITARKGTEMAKDGSVHSFTIKEFAEQGWNIRLKEGTQDYTLTAPSKPGEYVIECAVKCGPGHADQKMKLVVLPK